MNDSAADTREEIVALLPRLRRFARSICGNAHDADDIVQLAIERALLHLDQWKPGTRLDSWLFGIVRNAWIDETRSRSRRARIFAPEEAGAHVAAATESPLQMMSVQTAMGRLPEEQRLAVSLVLIEGLSYREAADVMQVPVGTLTSRLARGRDALEALLSDAEGDRK